MHALHASIYFSCSVQLRQDEVEAYPVSEGIIPNRPSWYELRLQLCHGYLDGHNVFSGIEMVVPNTQKQVQQGLPLFCFLRELLFLQASEGSIHKHSVWYRWGAAQPEKWNRFHRGSGFRRSSDATTVLSHTSTCHDGLT